MELIKTDRIPVIDSDKCILCNRCLEICPKQAITRDSAASCSRCIKYCISMDVPCKPVCYKINYDKCDSCGLCVTECKQGAIVWLSSVKEKQKKNNK